MIDFRRLTESICEASSNQSIEDHQRDCIEVDEMDEKMLGLLLLLILTKSPSETVHVFGHCILLAYRLGIEQTKIDVVISEMEKRNAQ